jgi:hypothetical protein
MASKNIHQWQPILSWGKTVCKDLGILLKTYNFAAVIIQTSFKNYMSKKKGDNTKLELPSLPRFKLLLNKSKVLIKRLTKTKCYASDKMDGTNVGIDEDSKLWGRRLALNSTLYQSVTVSSVRSVNVAGFTQAFKRHCPLQGNIRIVGELMCNDKYEAKKGTFYAFGLTIICSDSTEAQRLNLVLKEEFICQIKERKEVHVYMTSKLSSLFLKHNIPSVPVTGYKNMIDLMRDNALMLLDFKREGVVIVEKNNVGKWKNAKETGKGSHTSIRSFQSKIEKINGKFNFIDERISEMIDIMYRVASAKMTKEPPEIEVAFNSALTKYDDPSVYYAKGEMNMFIDMIVKEMKEDVTDPEVLEYVSKKIGCLFETYKSL